MRRVVEVLIAVLLLVILPEFAHARIERDKGHRRAFLVGCQTYGPGKDLKYAKRDVEELSRVLISRCSYHPDHIVTLVDKNSIAIKKEFTAFVKDIDPSDTVIVYYSGHGEADNEKQGFLVPPDAYENNKNKDTNFDSQLAIATSAWATDLKNAKAQATLLILDACHSGASALDPKGLAANATNTFAIISSCTEQEQSYEYDLEEHGIFTFVLINALRGENLPRSKGTISLSFLMAQLSRVTTIAQKEQGKSQTPLLLPQQGADFEIARMREPDVTIKIPFETVRPEISAKLAVPMVRVEAASGKNPFNMGIEKLPPNENLKPVVPLCFVEITRPFYVGAYEITQCQYDVVLARAAIRVSNLPVTKVSWFDAVEFCNRLSLLDNRPPYYTLKKPKVASDTIEIDGKQYDIKWIEDGEVEIANKDSTGYRLPTEAEWEYVARAGTRSLAVFGNALSSEKANFDGAHQFGPNMEKGRAIGRLVDVGSYLQPNLWGLYDVHGNADEWCYDLYESDFFKKGTLVTDPLGASPPRKKRNGDVLGHVSRGGHYNSKGTRCLLSARAEHGSGNIFITGLMTPNTGFRIVRNADPSQ